MLKGESTHRGIEATEITEEKRDMVLKGREQQHFSFDAAVIS